MNIKKSTYKKVGGVLLAASLFAMPFFVKANAGGSSTEGMTCKQGKRVYLFLEAEKMKTETIELTSTQYSEWETYDPDAVQEIFSAHDGEVWAQYPVQYRKIYQVEDGWFRLPLQKTNSLKTFNQYNAYTSDTDTTPIRKFYDTVILYGLDSWESGTDIDKSNYYFKPVADGGGTAVGTAVATDAKGYFYMAGGSSGAHNFGGTQPYQLMDYGADMADNTTFDYDLPSDATNVKFEAINSWDDNDFNSYIKMIEDDSYSEGDYRRHYDWASQTNGGSGDPEFLNAFNYWRKWGGTAYDTFKSQLKDALADNAIETSIVMGNNPDATNGGTIEDNGSGKINASIIRNYTELDVTEDTGFNWIVYKYAGEGCRGDQFQESGTCKEIPELGSSDGSLIKLAYNDFWMYAPAKVTVTYDYDCSEIPAGSVQSGIPSYGYLVIVLAGAAGVYVIAKKRNKFIKF